MASAETEETLDITQLEWKKIHDFCERGQQIIKQSSFGQNRRRLTILNSQLRWDSKYISLVHIRQLTIGNPPKKLFQRNSPNPALWLTVDGQDRRTVSLLFHDIPSRNFWVRAIIIYVGLLDEPLFIESAEELRSALNLNGNEADGTTHILSFSSSGLRPQILPYQGGGAPPPFTGEVQFQMICASNLPKADLFSKSDPYVVISNHLGQTVRTKTIADCHNPIWNEHLTLSVHDQQPLSIQIYDEDEHAKDDLLCCCTVDVAADCTVSKEVKFHRKMDSSSRPNHDKLSTLTFTALYRPMERQLIDIPDIGHETALSLTHTPNDSRPPSPTAPTPGQQGHAQRMEIPADALELSREKISSHSTSDIQIDYLDLHKKPHDVFRDMASAVRRSERGLFDEPSISAFSHMHSVRDNPISTSNINTVSDSSERHRSDINTESNVIDIEESAAVPDPLEIQNNPHKLYVVIGGREDKVVDIPENVCCLDIDKVASFEDEKRAAHCIDQEMEALSLKLFNSKHSFECLVLPKEDALEKRLPPELYARFCQLIRSIKHRNGDSVDQQEHLTNELSPPSPSAVGVRHDHDTQRSADRRKPPPIVTDIVKRSKSRDIELPPIPGKVLLSLGVEPLSKLTVGLMRNGEQFNALDLKVNLFTIIAVIIGIGAVSQQRVLI